MTKHAGGSFIGKGETLQVKLTVRAKPPEPVSVIVEVADWPATAMLTFVGLSVALKLPEGSAAFTAENASRSPKPSILFGTDPDIPGSGKAVEVRKFRTLARSVAGLTDEPEKACKTSAPTAAAWGAAAEVPAKKQGVSPTAQPPVAVVLVPLEPNPPAPVTLTSSVAVTSGFIRLAAWGVAAVGP